MTEKDVDTFCGLLQYLPADQLLSLYCECFSPFTVVWRTPAHAILCIRTWLRNVPTPQERLFDLAVLYSRLIPAGAFRPWMLFHLDTPFDEIDAFVFLETLSNRMKICTSGYTKSTSFLSCCVFLEDGDVAFEHRLICFNMWLNHPFLAIHAPGTISHSERLQTALEAVLGNPEKCLHGYYEELSSAYAHVLELQMKL
ncbi:hypothetical protein HPB50_008419 [Hyalomma asiaticum]|uniref:Uncharacterized protein n=1 Tax=Hyalomma asiaticum TaxID=266040 RepID=A0ACB7RPZ8_HYAAI|nr:hypothetical protein HPB50_008419 [Hyalomma asiaticum]